MNEEILLRIIEQNTATMNMLMARLCGTGAALPPQAPPPTAASALVDIPMDSGMQSMLLSEAVPMFSEFMRGRMKESSAANQTSLFYCRKHRELLMVSIHDLTWVFIQKWLDGIEKHTCALRDFVQVLRRLINWAREREICKTPEEFSKPFSFKKIEKKCGEELDEDDYIKLENYCLDNWRKQKGAFFTLIALHTGLRIGEVSGLRVGDLDVDNRTLSVNRTIQRVYDYSTKKTKVIIGEPKSKSSKRVIPINNILYDVLSEAIKGRKKDEPILMTAFNNPIEPREIRMLFLCILKKLKMKHYKFHSLRHSFISRHIRAGINPKAVSAYAGHSDLKMTIGVYTHINSNDLKEVANGGQRL